MDIKLESEDANFAFPEVASGSTPENKSATTRATVNGIGLGGISGARAGSGNGNSVGRVVGVTRPRPAMGVLTKRAHQGPITLTSQLCMYL
jgi:nuclear factor of activated T-cells 5